MLLRSGCKPLLIIAIAWNKLLRNFRFAERGFDEGVAGHISVRDPILTDHFWLNPLSQHFSQICVSDLILVNEDGDVVVGDEPINAAAFAIHSESRLLLHSEFNRGPNFLKSTRHAPMFTQHATLTPSTVKPSQSSAASWT